MAPFRSRSAKTSAPNSPRPLGHLVQLLNAQLEDVGQVDLQVLTRI